MLERQCGDGRQSEAQVVHESHHRCTNNYAGVSVARVVCQSLQGLVEHDQVLELVAGGLYSFDVPLHEIREESLSDQCVYLDSKRGVAATRAAIHPLCAELRVASELEQDRVTQVLVATGNAAESNRFDRLLIDRHGLFFDDDAPVQLRSRHEAEREVLQHLILARTIGHQQDALVFLIPATTLRRHRYRRRQCCGLNVARGGLVEIIVVVIVAVAVDAGCILGIVVQTRGALVARVRGAVFFIVIGTIEADAIDIVVRWGGCTNGSGSSPS